MSATTTCQKCGTLNAGWAKFCAKCGSPLTAAQPSAPTFQAPPQPYTPPTSPSPWYSHHPPAAFDFEDRTEIGRTKTGLLLLIIGVLLQPVPSIGIVGSLLILVGAILVILGRETFGSDHSRNTIWSIVIFIVGLAVYFISGVIIGFQLLVASRNGNGNLTSLSDALSSSLATLFVAFAIGTIVIGVAYVLFTYAIQNKNGRMILWVAYASKVVISTINLIIAFSLLSDAIAKSINGGVFNPGPIQDLTNQLQLLGLLNFIPAALFSAALYLVWSRIGRGELPANPQPSLPASHHHPQ